MTPRRWFVAVLSAALLCLAGCGGPFKFNDDEYRPLGAPASAQRDN
jgi:predicted small lipoprotein YifL